MSRAKMLAALAFASFTAACWGAGAEQIPQQIQKAVQSGAKIVTTFQAASQLKGWVLSRGGRYTMVFSTPDGKTLLAGELIDEAGNNLTEQYAGKYIPQPDRVALFAELEHSGYIAEGTLQAPKSVVYALFDPNCPFCHLAWIALQPYEKAGLQVRWVPVAYLMPSSPGKAAAIMEAKDRRAALRRNEEQYDAQRHEGGIQALAKPAAGTLKQLRANNELMQKLGANGTPALVWKGAHGAIEMKVGLPRLHELPGITGLPEQPESDPELDRFR